MVIKHVLVAGAGDLGQRSAHLLLAQGHEVWGLRRHPPAASASKINWLTGDLTRTETLSHIPQSISHVVYAPTPDQRSEEHYRAIFLQGLKNLLSVLNQSILQRFLFVSSSAVYGQDLGQLVDESTPAAAIGFNGRVLIEAERWLGRRWPEAIMFRLSGLYGPGRIRLLKRLQEGQARTPRDAIRWVNHFHTDDAARAIVHLLTLDQPERCYIGTDNCPQTINELYGALAAMLDITVACGTGPATTMASSGKRLSNARLRASGFDPTWPRATEGYLALITAMRNSS